MGSPEKRKGVAMTLRVSLAFLAITLAVFGNAKATSVSFDDFDAGGGIRLASPDRYRWLGVVFSDSIPIGTVCLEPWFCQIFQNLGGTLPNALALGAYNAPPYSIEASFVVPGTAIPATTDFVSVLFCDSEVGSLLGCVEAYDSSGTLIDSRCLPTPQSMGAVIEVSAPGIARVRISTDVDGGWQDNLWFTEPRTAGVPTSFEPPARASWGAVKALYR
jgi:hypothetical protein